MVGVVRQSSATLATTGIRASAGQSMSKPQQQSILTVTERIVIALVFVAAIGVSVVVVARLGTSDDYVVGPPENRPIVPNSVDRPVPVLDAFDVAFEWARTWNEDAWPILISAQFEFPSTESEPVQVANRGLILFTFAAPKDGDTWPRLTLAVSRQSGMIYYEDDLESEVEPPDSIEQIVRELPVPAEQAFRVAEEVVGTDYRADCAEHRRAVQVILDATDPDAPAWVVVYYDERERSTNDIVMRIDATTGATTTEDRDDPSCDIGA